MAFTKIAAAGISSSGSFTLENSTVTGVLTATSATVGSGITLSGTQINVGSATTIQSTGILLRNVGASGIVTATGGFVGNVTGTSTGLSGTPNITVGSIIASSAVISGNVSVAGTVTYEDVTNVDSVGVITARSGIVVAAGTTAAPSISPTGDSNTGIFFPSPDTVAIAEGGTEVLRVDSNGNLGIGITNPSSILNVGSKTLTVNTDNQIILSGRQVVTPGSFASFYFKNSNDSGASSASIRAIRNGDNYGTELAFFTQNSGGVSGGDGLERIRIGRSGNIGIGLTNPQFQLQTTGNALFNSAPALGNGYLIDYYMGNWNDPGSYPEYMLLGRINSGDIFRVLGQVYGTRGGGGERNVFFNICCSKSDLNTAAAAGGRIGTATFALVTLTYAGNSWVALQSGGPTNTGGLNLSFTGQIYHSYSSTQWTHKDFYGSVSSIPSGSVSSVTTIVSF